MLPKTPKSSKMASMMTSLLTTIRCLRFKVLNYQINYKIKLMNFDLNSHKLRKKLIAKRDKIKMPMNG